MKKSIRALIESPHIYPLIRDKASSLQKFCLKQILGHLDYRKRLIVVTFLKENNVCLKSEGIKAPALELTRRKDRRIFQKVASRAQYIP